MLKRRQCLAAATLCPAAVWAMPLADVLARPAHPVRLSSKPSMLRIARAGDRLVAVGERGLVLLSDDDGRQWRQGEVPVSVTLTGVQFTGPKVGWAIGHAAVVLHTRDGGESWTLQFDGRRLPEGPANPLLDLMMLDETRGWAVGAYGMALATRDGGATWLPQHAGFPNPKGLHLYALARQGDALFMVGEQGLFIRTSADSREGSATPLPTPYRGSFFTITALPEGALLLGGLRGTLLLRQARGDFTALDSGTSHGIVSCTALGPLRHALVDQSGRVMLGGGESGRFTALPADVERRWVAVALARDGALVGAGNIGVGRLVLSGQGTSTAAPTRAR